ncbi:MAG: protease modulator HflC [Pseudomonadota bacterium]
MSKPPLNSTALGASLAGLGLLVLGLASLYTVDARELAVVLSFGAPVRTVDAPGLYLKAPWPLQEVVRFDRRARVLAVPPSEVLTQDKKNLVVEAYTLWRVKDPQRFLEALRAPGVEEVRWADLVSAAEVRLGDLVTSRIAGSLGKQEFTDLLAVDTTAVDLLPAGVAAGVMADAADRFGVQVLDVRLRHLGLPLQNEQSIYERMRAERKRIANQYRSEGEEQATTIRAKADRQAAEILAEADRDAARVRADAEAGAARLYAETYRQDPEFYRYLRGLDTLQQVLEPGEGAAAQPSILVLDEGSDIFAPLTRSPK